MTDRYTAEQDRLLAAIGRTREDFPGFMGVTSEDEHIRVWTAGGGNWLDRPRNLVDVEPGMDRGELEYIFMPLADTFTGTVELDCGA